MKCPKCKKELGEYGIGTIIKSGDILICENEKCEYYGIERRDLRSEPK